MTEIDWSTELRKIEREFDGLPPEPTPAELREWRLEAGQAQRRHDELNGLAGAWMRLVLVAVLAGALRFWPYAHGCGFGLYGYLGAEGTVMLGGVWVAIYSWHRRAGWAHTTALVMSLWGMALIGVEALPRVGYAMPDATRPANWACRE